MVMKKSLMMILLAGLLSGCGFFGGDDGGVSETAILRGQIPNTELTEESMITLAAGFEDAGDLTSALRLYAHVVSENPDNLEAQLGLARVYEGASAYNLARRGYGLAFELAPDNGEAAAGVAVGLIRSNETRSARILLKNFLATEGRDADVLNIFGVLLDLEGQHEIAQITYMRALDLRANDVQVMNNLALSFGLSGDFAAGIALMEDMDRQGRVDRQHVRNLAILHALAGNPERAAFVAASFYEGLEQEGLVALFERILLLDPVTRRRVVLLGESPSVLPELSPEPEPEPEPEAPVLAPEPESEMDPEPESLVPPFRPAPSPTGLYWVQIGAFQGAGQLQLAWDILAERFSSALSALRPHIQPFESGDRGHFTRLLVGGYDRIEVARDQCAQFKGAGLDCFVVFASEALEQLPRE